MKTIVKYTLLALLCIGTNNVLADTPQTISFIVKNNTSQTLVVQSAETTDLMYNIKINGTTDTPSVTLAPHSQGKFTITENVQSSATLMGTIYIGISRGALAPMQDQTQYNIMTSHIMGVRFDLSPDPTSQSQSYAVSALMLDDWTGLVEINQIK